ncbi:hypothetical protein FRB90_011912, partial [Tulasnella sp. 427]
IWRVGDRRQRFQQFLIFFSDDPRALSICGGNHKTVRQALLNASEEKRPRPSFRCRPPNKHEKQWVAEKVTSSDPPFVGADWVVAQDHQTVTIARSDDKQSRRSRRSTRAGQPKGHEADGATEENQPETKGSSTSQQPSRPNGASNELKRTADAMRQEDIDQVALDQYVEAGPSNKSRTCKE